MGVCGNPRAPRGSCCGGIGLNDMRRANVFIVSAVSAAVISLGLFYVLSSNGSSSGVEQNIPQTTIQIGDAVLFVEVLDTQEQRRGTGNAWILDEGYALSHRSYMDKRGLARGGSGAQYFARHLSCFFPPFERCPLCIGNKRGLGKRA